MSALPNRGDVIDVFQPGGPVYRMKFLREDPTMTHVPPHEPGWVWLEGILVAEDVQQTLYAHWTGEWWEMVPH